MTWKLNQLYTARLRTAEPTPFSRRTHLEECVRDIAARFQLTITDGELRDGAGALVAPIHVDALFGDEPNEFAAPCYNTPPEYLLLVDTRHGVCVCDCDYTFSFVRA